MGIREDIKTLCTYSHSSQTATAQRVMDWLDNNTKLLKASKPIKGVVMDWSSATVHCYPHTIDEDFIFDEKKAGYDFREQDIHWMAVEDLPEKAILIVDEGVLR